MKSRTTHSTKVSETTVKYRLRIEDIPSAVDSQEAHGRMTTLLRAVVDQPALLMCGPAPPSSLRVYHNGFAWILEAEATVFTPQS
jgi:hypothetical protein